MRRELSICQPSSWGIKSGPREAIQPNRGVGRGVSSGAGGALRLAVFPALVWRGESEFRPMYSVFRVLPMDPHVGVLTIRRPGQGELPRTLLAPSSVQADPKGWDLTFTDEVVVRDERMGVENLYSLVLAGDGNISWSLSRNAAHGDHPPASCKLTERINDCLVKPKFWFAVGLSTL